MAKIFLDPAIQIRHIKICDLSVWCIGEGGGSHKGTELFISKGFIKGHGGKIWGKNNPDGRGATFSFSLPLEENQ